MNRRLTEEERSAIIAMYSDGRAICDIARCVGVHVTTVARVAKKGGVLRSVAEAQAVRAAREVVGWSRFGKKGAVQSAKTGRWFACDSAYEYVRMHQLDEDPSVAEWVRCEDRIRYVFNGQCLVYVPDIKVIRTDQSVIIEEIKPTKFVDKPKNLAKFAAAKAFYGELGIAFVVVTEADIGWSAIRRWDGVALHGVPDEERSAKRRAAALKVLRNMTPEQRKEYNRKAKEREARKRSENRDAYNAKAREYRTARRARITIEELEKKRRKSRERLRTWRASLTPEQLNEHRRRDREAKRLEYGRKKTAVELAT